MLTWTRLTPGHYVAGPFTIVAIEPTPTGLRWTLESTGRRPVGFRTLAEAKAHAARIIGNGR